MEGDVTLRSAGVELAAEHAVAIPANTKGLLFMGSDAGIARRVQVDDQGRIVFAPIGVQATTRGFVQGQKVQAATTVAAVTKTAYTEPTSAAGRSISSSSASDTNSAGTGARKVKLTYYDNTAAGPFTETINLNGTTAVNTTATDIRFIERIEVVEVGSGGSNVGTITLFGAAGGAGGTVWTIAVGDNQTFSAHHYVATGKTCSVTGFLLGIKGAGTAGGFIRAIEQLGTNPVDRQVGDTIRTPSSGAFFRQYGTPIEVAGPARITAYVAPDSSSSRTYYASFDFFEE